ncbi:long-chain-fatty-acid--CoA ligase [Acuticoccus kandeliae]|uniref:long-chain-fatty-acid--CoA ligase n=1 Tax=Acuticoccus kandeliae TaxID=2073160 RepID=UPI0031831411
MQDWPLLVHKIIDHAGVFHPTRKVVTRRPDGEITRTDYAGIRHEARRIVARLVADGIRPGERIAALAWNTDRHLALWYGVMGAGAVHHTVNPRLFHEQIAFIINDAADRILFADATFLPMIETIAPQLKSVERIVIFAPRAGLPPSPLPIESFDEWLGDIEPAEWVEVDERAACGMCYTSGTTGLPKGVVYSHRSNVIHALAMSAPDMLGPSCHDVIMPVVPMFHANSWALPFAAPMQGAAMVMPGSALDGASLYELMETEGVTCTAGVPTVWLGLLNHMDATNSPLSTVRRIIIGGSACPRAMTERFEKDYGIEVIHAWGMTEMSPLGTMATLMPEHDALDLDGRLRVKESQGRPPFTVELKVVDDEGRTMPRDGRTFGRLMVRGPAVTAHYHGGAADEHFDGEGWFDTGDVATLNALGFMRITDRSKDVIKSGGEWISSIDLENLAMSHPAVAEAAVVGVPHPKWTERPILIVVKKPGAALEGAEILAHMRPHVARWWLPDSVVFVDEIPHTATGKIQKTTLREDYRDAYQDAE